MAARKRVGAFLKQFCKASSLEEMQAPLDAGSDGNAFSELACQALMLIRVDRLVCYKLVAQIMSSAAKA
ncbi:MAG: hypothetical protein ACLQHK_05335 [Gallionellaceae bacterium]